MSTDDFVRQPQKKPFSRVCSCKKMFRARTTYYEHAKKCPSVLSLESKTPQTEECSSQDQNEIPEKNIFKTCLCEKEFKTKYSYFTHKKNCSIAQEGKAPGNFSCLEEGCSFSASISDDFLGHLKEIHSIMAIDEVKVFQNYSDFKNWLQLFEKQERSSFLRQSSKIYKSRKVEYYYCNRGGKYLSMSTGRRCPRLQGSRKIGFNCPASIKADIEIESSLVKAKVKSLHYGHDLDLRHINISKRLYCGVLNEA